MSLRLNNIWDSLFGQDPTEKRKVFLLTIAFLLVIGGYTILKELKDIIFLNIVGATKKYNQYAKILSMVALIPVIFLHSRLVDILKKHVLLYFYSYFYGTLCILFAFFLGYKNIGLENTVSSPYRFIGWAFYFFIETYSPLLLSSFWAFANSVTSPENSNRNFTTMIIGSKTGGLLAVVLSFCVINLFHFSDIVNHQILLIIPALTLISVTFIIRRLIRSVPQKAMHGYEAAYRIQKEEEKHSKPSQKSYSESMLSGLTLLLKYKYLMGIFGMQFFFELTRQMVKIENVLFVCNDCALTLSEKTMFLLKQAGAVHMVGLIFVLFGTRILVDKLGVKKSLVLIPLLTGVSAIGFIFMPTYLTAFIAFLITSSVNYAFASPLKETLYVLTVKEVQFKTKAWIDGFGGRLAKVLGSSITRITDIFGGSELMTIQGGLFTIIFGMWGSTAYSLGRRYEDAVVKNEVIGTEE